MRRLGLALLLALLPHLALADAPGEPRYSRIAAIDWGLAETLLGIGVTPIAVGGLENYRRWVGEPVMPDSVQDLGLRTEPNLELLTQLKPDLILISKELEMAYDSFNAIAPTMVLSIYNNDKDALPTAREVMEKIAIAIGREDAAKTWLAATDLKFAEYGDRIRAAMPKGHDLDIVNFVSPTHISLYGPPSLPGTVLRKMGLSIAYQGPVTNWGAAKGGLEILGPQAQNTLVYLNPVPDVIRQKVWTSPLWKILDFVRNDRVYELPVVWAYGGMPSALRFAQLLTESLESGPVK